MSREMRRLHAAYEARRAAALAGVPVSTVYYWARTGIWVPALHEGRPKLWSYSDLLALRLIDWLRNAKPDLRIPPTPMGRIRDLLVSAEDMGAELRSDSVRVWVDEGGRVVLQVGDQTYRPLGSGKLQALVNLEINLVAEFQGREGVRAPDLVRPRGTLRIVPGKLSSEPHVEGTRIPTRVLMALKRRELSEAQIGELYPALSAVNIHEAIDLEEQLERKPRSRAA